MTQDEIIRMAREAGVSIRGYYDETGSTPQELERFAALVAAHERERVMNEPLTKAMWDRFESEIRADEREVCAKVCEDDMGWLDNGGGELCAKAIRSRGEK